MIYPDLDINGMKTETDVCDMICDTIDDGNLSDAMDYVGQFKDYLIKKESCLLYTSPSPRDTNPSRMPSSA